MRKMNANAKTLDELVRLFRITRSQARECVQIRKRLELSTFGAGSPAEILIAIDDPRSLRAIAYLFAQDEYRKFIEYGIGRTDEDAAGRT